MPAGRSAFAPLVLLGLAGTIGAGAAVHQARREYDVVAAARLGQKRAHENARRMRDALDSNRQPDAAPGAPGQS